MTDASEILVLYSTSYDAEYSFEHLFSNDLSKIAVFTGLYPQRVEFEFKASREVGSVRILSDNIERVELEYISSGDWVTLCRVKLPKTTGKKFLQYETLLDCNPKIKANKMRLTVVSSYDTYCAINKLEIK